MPSILKTALTGLCMKNNLNGVLSVYKPKGTTSRQAATDVQLLLTKHVWQTDRPWEVKRKDRVKVGMGGILDPLAEGVLGKVICYQSLGRLILTLPFFFSVLIQSARNWQRL
jgi:tRNA U55 pseudouridine synthase TruB